MKNDLCEQFLFSFDNNFSNYLNKIKRLATIDINMAIERLTYVYKISA